jgi:hypothetical protein
MTSFTERNLDDLINSSFQFGDEDKDLLMAGLKLAQRNLRPREDFLEKKDYLVENGLSTEFIFNCNLKNKHSGEPLMKADVPVKREIVLDIGPEKTIYTNDFNVDRYTGFTGVTLAEKLCEAKEILLEDGRDPSLITPVDIEPLMMNYMKIDNFRPPQVESKVDDDMVAMYKRTYNNFLDTVITSQDTVIYIEGDFGAAGLRRLNHKADCIYFVEEQWRRAQKDRKINNTSGEDFLFSYDNEEWKEKIKKYTFVIHNFLFGQIYQDLLEIKKENPEMSLVAAGVNPDKSDKEIYILQPRKPYLEAYALKEEFAYKYGMQIMYDDDYVSVVYFDHGRYEDLKPHSYGMMVPFVELDSWENKRIFRAYNHLALFLSGPVASIWKEAYYFEKGKKEIRKVRREEVVVNGDSILLPGIPNGNILLLNNQIVDYEDVDKPYWMRRHNLKRAGVIFEEAKDPYYVVSRNADFDSLVTLEEYGVIEEIRKKPIQPFFEVSNIGWHPCYKKLTYDVNCKSIVTPYVPSIGKDDGMRLTVDHNEIEDKMSLRLDPLGDFVLFTTISYSMEFLEVVEVPDSGSVSMEEDNLESMNPFDVDLQGFVFDGDPTFEKF